MYRFFYIRGDILAVIKDVASFAGVSISTVSKYFNNPQGMSEEYRQKVAAAVEALDFTPNAMARSLRTKRTNIIALIVPEITNTFYVEVYNNIRLAATSKGYMTQLYTTEESINILQELLSQLSSSKIDGIILCTRPDPGHNAHRSFELGCRHAVQLRCLGFNTNCVPGYQLLDSTGSYKYRFCERAGGQSCLYSEKKRVLESNVR